MQTKILQLIIRQGLFW